MPIHIRSGLLLLAIVAGACIDDIPEDELEASDGDDTSDEARGLGLVADADPAELPPVGESPLCPVSQEGWCLQTDECFIFNYAGTDFLRGTNSRGWNGFTNMPAPREPQMCYSTTPIGQGALPVAPCGPYALCGPVCY